MRITPRRPTLWIAVGTALLALLPLLALLQYRWIGEVSQAERERMQANLRTATTQFSQEFNQELTRACVAFQIDLATLLERDWQKYAGRYEHWLQTAPYPNLVRNLFFVEAQEGVLRFLRLDPAAGRFEPADWPPQTDGIRQRLEALARGGPRDAVPGMRPFGWTVAEEIPALVLPLFRFPSRAGPPRPGFPAPEGPPPLPPLIGCSIVELNVEFLQNQFFPELARKHFATRDGFAYQVAVVSRRDPGRVIYRSDPNLAYDFFSSADATANVLALRPQDFFRFSTERVPAGASFGRGPGRGGGFGGPANLAGGDIGQWQLLVKHRSGSLETALAQARRRNLAISFSILLLLAASVVMIMVFTERAQRLAKLQIDFVAGVSHELRTPLAVICSAADNLADGVVGAREQMQQYGSLIRSEGRRLSEMIDQILGFTAVLNRKRQELRPVEVAGVIESAVATSASAFSEAGVEVARQIAPHLPPVMADVTSLAACLHNLISNALKYGKGSGWIGIRAQTGNGERGAEVQISVEDKGPGIDPADLPHIFEPFYRGAGVVAAQIHGTGLGLSLVKEMIEAQGGKVTVKSAPGQGSAFTLHLPAVARENGAGAAAT